MLSTTEILKKLSSVTIDTEPEPMYLRVFKKPIETKIRIHRLIDIDDHKNVTKGHWNTNTVVDFIQDSIKKNFSIFLDFSQFEDEEEFLNFCFLIHKKGLVFRKSKHENFVLISKKKKKILRK